MIWELQLISAIRFGSSSDNSDVEWPLNPEDQPDERASDEDDSEDGFSDDDLNECGEDVEMKYGAGVY
jgi:hypothetical protein